MAMPQRAIRTDDSHDSPARTGPTPSRRARARMLVVEDHDDTREALAVLLKTEGYETTVAADGEAGLASARASRPDVAIVDIFLPGKDGVAVIEELRRDLPSVAIIAVSADTSADRRGALIRAREAGAHHTLRKPLEPWVLLSTIAGVVSAPGDGARP
jgi:DNA-binding response OmpR family regulator